MSTCLVNVVELNLFKDETRIYVYVRVAILNGYNVCNVSLAVYTYSLNICASQTVN